MTTNATSPTTWQLGQKVTCIDDRFSPEAIQLCDVLPQAGRAYTVRAIKTTCGETALLLEEIKNSRKLYGREPGFWQSRFRAS